MRTLVRTLRATRIVRTLRGHLKHVGILVRTLRGTRRNTRLWLSPTFWCARITHPRASPPQGPSLCLRASSDLLHVRHLVGLRIIRPQSSSPYDSSVPIVRLISFNASNADLTDDLTDLATDLDRDHVTASISFCSAVWSGLLGEAALGA